MAIIPLKVLCSSINGRGPLAVGDNRRKRHFIAIGDVDGGGGVSGGEEEVGVPFDEGVHLQTRRWGSNDRSKSHLL